MGGVIGDKHSRGVALVAVLWVVAALTIMVGGAIYGSRAETRAVTVDRQLARAAALADAVLAQVLQAWTRPGERRPTGATHLQLGFDGVDMELMVYPATGLVDINTAPEAVLAAVFVHGAGLAPEAATAAAQAVEAARQQPEFKVLGSPATRVQGSGLPICGAGGTPAGSGHRLRHLPCGVRPVDRGRRRRWAGQPHGCAAWRAAGAGRG